MKAYDADLGGGGGHCHHGLLQTLWYSAPQETSIKNGQLWSLRTNKLLPKYDSGKYENKNCLCLYNVVIATNYKTYIIFYNISFLETSSIVIVH